jgi:hypothetical protein
MRNLQDMSPRQIITLAATVSFIFLVSWVGIIALAWLVFGPTGADGGFWSSVESLSTAATLATVVGGGFFVLAQLVESIDSRKREIAATNLEAYNTIFDQMMSDSNIEARRWIYQNLPEDPREGLGSLTEEGRSCVKLILNSFDRLGFMLQQDLISSDAIIGWVSPFVVKTWVKLQPYVDMEIARRNEPDYYEAAAYLAGRCIEWRREHVPDAVNEFVWLKDAL